jgi:glycosyltransferase involved in cell wall biosynthesis
MTKLGMPEAAVFTGCAVVDNGYFERGADSARAAGASERARLGLPPRFFVSSSRFIPKKNLETLLHAYARFRELEGEHAPKLVLLGGGPLWDDLLRLRKTLALEQDVLLPGFQQYHALPIYYGLAEAFVLVSTTEQWGLVINEAMASGLPVIVSRSCGCTPELVSDGENGILVDALDVEGVVRALTLLSRQSDIRERMGRRGRQMIKGWSPTTFAQQVLRAREAAVAVSRRTKLIDRPLLTALAMRHGLALGRRAPGAT